MQKKLFTLFLVLLLLINLSGCRGRTSNTSEDTDLLLQTIDQIKNIESYEIAREEYVLGEDGETVSQIITETKIIIEPFTNWSRTDGKYPSYESLTEVYQVLDDNQFDTYIRYDSLDAVGILGDWENPVSVDKELASIVLDSMKDNYEAQIYLLDTNIGTFKVVESDELKDENLIKYDGYFEQDTILEAYQKYLRGYYVKVGFLPDLENPTLGDLKNEITSGEYIELQEGIPRLAFSQAPLPISLWINQKTLQLERVVIDETSALQSLMNLQKENPGIIVPQISQATITYEVRGINHLEEIPMPE